MLLKQTVCAEINQPIDPERGRPFKKLLEREPFAFAIKKHRQQLCKHQTK